MNRILVCIALVLCLGCTSGAAEPKLETDQDKALYAMGVMLSTNLASYKLTEAELELIKAGLTDGVLNREKKVEPESMRAAIQELGKSRLALVMEDNKNAGKAFLEKAVADEGAVRKDSGLLIKMIQEGSGESPAPADTVKVHYTGTLIDGTVFDSSVQRGQPATFALNRVVSCWTEGLQLMKPGGKAKLYCPPEMAYGDQGRPKIPPGATLVFEVELLEVTKAAAPAAPTPPATP